MNEGVLKTFAKISTEGKKERLGSEQERHLEARLLRRPAATLSRSYRNLQEGRDLDLI